MKRLFKSHHSKRGFTLVEVMLAVAILVIASTMIMRGFLAVMSYSYNSTVLARAAASDYSDILFNIGKFSRTYHDTKDNDALANVTNVQVSQGAMQVTVSNGVALPNSSWNITVWHKHGATASDINALGSITTDYNEDTSVVDDRVGFFINIPETTPASESGDS